MKRVLSFNSAFTLSAWVKLLSPAFYSNGPCYYIPFYLCGQKLAGSLRSDIHKMVKSLLDMGLEVTVDLKDLIKEEPIPSWEFKGWKSKAAPMWVIPPNLSQLPLWNSTKALVGGYKPFDN